MEYKVVTFTGDMDTQPLRNAVFTSLDRAIAAARCQHELFKMSKPMIADYIYTVIVDVDCEVDDDCYYVIYNEGEEGMPDQASEIANECANRAGKAFPYKT